MTDRDDFSGYSVDDTTQLQPADTLDGDLDRDVLDDGYTPPDHYVAADRFGTTPREQQQGEGLERRLREEEPEVWEREDKARQDRVGGDDPDAIEGQEDFVGDADPGRPVGHLVAPDEGAHEDTEAAAIARDAGDEAGTDLSAEESAMHLDGRDDLNDAIDDETGDQTPDELGER